LESIVVKLGIYLLIAFIWLSGFMTAKCFAAESVDQYLDRMRMRRDSVDYQACLENLKYTKADSSQSNNITACVPPDYNTEQEAWRSGEWQGTVMGVVG